jgi:hypothetical protein
MPWTEPQPWGFSYRVGGPVCVPNGGRALRRPDAAMNVRRVSAPKVVLFPQSSPRSGIGNPATGIPSALFGFKFFSVLDFRT